MGGDLSKAGHSASLAADGIGVGIQRLGTQTLPEVERLLASLRANLDNPIEEVGDRATMSYGEGAAVQMVLEDGLWKIEDPD